MHWAVVWCKLGVKLLQLRGRAGVSERIEGEMGSSGIYELWLIKGGDHPIHFMK